jgi:hypothetical protein
VAACVARGTYDDQIGACLLRQIEIVKHLGSARGDTRESQQLG